MPGFDGTGPMGEGPGTGGGFGICGAARNPGLGGGFAGYGRGPGRRARRRVYGVDAVSSEVADLRRQVDELKSRLDSEQNKDS